MILLIRSESAHLVGIYPFFDFDRSENTYGEIRVDENSKIFEISRDEKGGDNGYTRFILGDGHLPKEKELIIK